MVYKFFELYILLQVESFFRKYPDAGAGRRGRQRALENIKTNIAWMNDNYYIITSWLEANT